MIVAFKPIGKREHAALRALGVRHLPPQDSPRYGYSRGSVVTIDGFIVVAFGRDGQVIYQDGSDAVPDLIRAYKRVWLAAGLLTYEDRERIKRRGRPQRTVEDILAGRA